MMASILLKAPHISQHGNVWRNDCAQGSTAIIDCAVTSDCSTINEVILKTNTGDNQFTSILGFISMLMKMGVDVVYSSTATLDLIRSKLLELKPVASLLDYRAIEAYSGFENDYAHFSVWIGFDDERQVMILDDTLSNIIEVPYHAAQKAISTPSLTNAGANRPYQAVLPKTQTAQIVTRSARRAGVNLDPFGHWNGMPDPDLLKGVKYARLPVKVSNSKGGVGNLDWQQTLDVLIPYLKRLIANGITPILIFLHQTYGEALIYPGSNNQVYNFGSMDALDWTRYMYGEVSFPGALAFNEPIIERLNRELGGANFVIQWWNEQDAQPGAEASVPIPAPIYGSMYRAFHALVKRINPLIKVITGGHLSGADGVVTYFKTSGIAVTDGIGYHAYTMGAKAVPYLKSNNIEDALRIFDRDLPTFPLWITEAGGFPEDTDLDQFYEWTAGMVTVTEARAIPFTPFPVGQLMHKMRGYIDQDKPLKDRQGRIPLNLLKRDESDIPPQEPTGELMLGFTGKLICSVYGLNFRKTAALPLDNHNLWTDAGKPIVLYSGEPIEVYIGAGSVVQADGKSWHKIRARGRDGFIAADASKTLRASVSVVL
jgi:hypothetical protein